MARPALLAAVLLLALGSACASILDNPVISCLKIKDKEKCDHDEECSWWVCERAAQLARARSLRSVGSPAWLVIAILAFRDTWHCRDHWRRCLSTTVGTGS